MTEEIPEKDERPITERLSDPEITVRMAALGEILSLERLPQELIPEIAKRLLDEEEDCCILAMVALANAETLAVPYLINALSAHRPVTVRAFAASTLGRMDCDRTSAVPDLCRCLRDNDPELRQVSSLALARIGAPAVPALHAALPERTSEIRISIVQTLGQIGPPARETISTLNQLAAGQPAEVLISIACAMIQILQDPQYGLSFLISSAAAESALRENIIEQMGMIGPVVRGGSDSILHYLQDPSPCVRAATAITLARIWIDHVDQHPSHILDSLMRALDDPDPKVRANAGIAISAFGPYAERIVPALERHITDADEQVAAVARAAIDKIRGQQASNPD
jgi:HEAT repeat protein